jgi:hypothetical protein
MKRSFPFSERNFRTDVALAHIGESRDSYSEQTMKIAKSAWKGALSRNPEAREIHEIAYFIHRTGARRCHPTGD